MTKMIFVNLADNTKRIEVPEGATAPVMVALLKAAGFEVGQTSVRQLLNKRVEHAAGFGIEVDGKMFKMDATTAADQASAKNETAASQEVKTQAVEAPKPAATAASAKKAPKAKAKKAPKAKAGATTAARAVRTLKVYKVTAQAKEATGNNLMKRIVDAIREGKNTQQMLIDAFPEVKKSTVQHEICRAGQAWKKWIAVDDKATKAAQAAAAKAREAEAAKTETATA